MHIGSHPGPPRMTAEVAGAHRRVLSDGRGSVQTPNSPDVTLGWIAPRALTLALPAPGTGETYHGGEKNVLRRCGLPQKVG